MIRSNPLSISRFYRPRRTCASGLALPIACTSAEINTLIWLGNYPIFLKRMWSIVGMPNTRMFFKSIKRVITHNPILSLSDTDRSFNVFAEASDLPLALLCYKRS